jgi:predicted amidohydrolase YtcJ
MRLLLLTVPGLAGLVLMVGCSRMPSTADLILVNGRVYTLDWDEPAPDGTPAADAPLGADGWYPDAGAVAIADGLIIYTGTAEGVEQFRGPETVVRDLGGATVLPGLIESHVHINEVAENLNRIDLRGLHTEEEIYERLVEGSEGYASGEWVVGWGWDEGLWANRYPDNRRLSELFPENPVLVDGLHGFGVWGNRLALAEAGVTAATGDPPGGEIVRDRKGEPTGVLVNQAVNLLREAVPPPSLERRMATLRTALLGMAADGFVCVHQAGTKRDMMEALEGLEAAGDLPIRVYAMISTRDEALTREWIERGPDRDTDSMLRVCSVKAYYDASLGSRGAKMLEDYSDMPGHRGVSGEEYGYDEALVAEAMRAGFQAAIHAIGDAGNRDVLDFYQGVIESDARTRDYRHRIEHAQVVHPDDFIRFGEIELIASMEPPHTVEDKAWLEDRIGPDRCRNAFAWRTLRIAGAGLTFNSDLPGSDHDIFYGLHAAITRRDRDLQPPGGWYPDQAVLPEEAIRAYTSWSAYASLQEEATGVIAPGRFADITVMDIDPFVVGSTEPAGLLEGLIVLTVVGGEIVFERD